VKSLAVLERPADVDVTDPRLVTLLWLVLGFVIALIVLVDRSEEDPTNHSNTASKREGALAAGTGSRDAADGDDKSPTDLRRETGDHPQESEVFARRLAQLREAIVASGEPLLSWEELDGEIAERRGEVA
jgi:hypothetical protein